MTTATSTSESSIRTADLPPLAMRVLAAAHATLHAGVRLTPKAVATRLGVRVITIMEWCDVLKERQLWPTPPPTYYAHRSRAKTKPVQDCEPEDEPEVTAAVAEDSPRVRRPRGPCAEQIREFDRAWRSLFATNEKQPCTTTLS